MRDVDCAPTGAKTWSAVVVNPALHFGSCKIEVPQLAHACGRELIIIESEVHVGRGVSFAAYSSCTRMMDQDGGRYVVLKRGAGGYACENRIHHARYVVNA